MGGRCFWAEVCWDQPIFGQKDFRKPGFEIWTDMGVSKNRGTPKWMVYVLMENPIKNGSFAGTTMFGNTHVVFEGPIKTVFDLVFEKLERIFYFGDDGPTLPAFKILKVKLQKENMSVIYIYMIYNSSGSGGSFQCVVPFLGEFWSHLNKCRRCPIWLDSLRWTCWNICLQEQWQINFEFATHDVDQIRMFNESERSPGIKKTSCEMQQRSSQNDWFFQILQCTILLFVQQSRKCTMSL